jgi:hypothetical protein
MHHVAMMMSMVPRRYAFRSQSAEVLGCLAGDLDPTQVCCRKAQRSRCDQLLFPCALNALQDFRGDQVADENVLRCKQIIQPESVRGISLPEKRDPY